MKAKIVHESRGRMRLRLSQKKMTVAQADLLELWLHSRPWVEEAAVHERTCCAVVRYNCERSEAIAALAAFTWAEAGRTVTPAAHSTRAINRTYQEKLVGKVLIKAAALFLPTPCVSCACCGTRCRSCGEDCAVCGGGR